MGARSRVKVDLRRKGPVRGQVNQGQNDGQENHLGSVTEMAPCGLPLLKTATGLDLVYISTIVER